MANKYTGTKTEQNLLAAFAGESQARNKYTYFAPLLRSWSEVSPTPRAAARAPPLSAAPPGFSGLRLTRPADGLQGPVPHTDPGLATAPPVRGGQT